MKIARPSLLFASLLTSITAVGCTSSSDEAAPAFNAGVSLTGEFDVTQTVTASRSDGQTQCPPVGTVDTSRIRFTQNGSTVTIVDTATTSEGTLTGRTLRVNLDETITLSGTALRIVQSLVLTFSADGTSATGTLQTTSTINGALQCDVASRVELSRVGGGGTGGGGGTAASSLSNVDIDGQGGSAVVQINTPFTVSADFNITNPDNCPSCIRQLVLGFDDEGQGCLFDGIPATDPGQTGSNSLTMQATRIGTFDLRFQDNFEFTCPDALANFSTGGSEAVGTITVVDPQVFSFAPLNVSLNGQGNVITVSPGQQVSVDLDFEIWQSASCPNCINQITIGLENEPIDCAFNGQVATFPGIRTSSQVSFTAPAAPGTYRIRYRRSQEFTCEDARARYARTPPAENGIATIIVR